MPFLILLFAFLVRLGLLFAAAWLLTLAVPQVLADPDHFVGWLGILVAAGIAVTPTSTSISGK